MQGFGRGGGYRGPSDMQFSQFGYNQQDQYGDEDDDPYGMEQYYDEDSDDAEDLGPEYLQNVPPGALFQGGARPGGMAQAPPTYGGVNPTSGVPFYGSTSQNRMVSSAGFGAAGSASKPGMGMGMGMGMAAMSTNSAGGGFTYGMASQGGNLFGAPSQSANVFGTSATSFGANSNTFGAPSNTNLFAIGSASQFGGIGGGGASLFGAAPTGGPMDDPYGNIPLDFSKVKSAPPPAKLHELKTEEEKKKEAAEKKTASGASKSNLKKEYGNDDGKEKRNVKFGVKTTYEITGEDSENGDSSSDNLRAKGSPRVQKKIIEEVDLSDGRNEIEKAKALLEQQEKEQLEEARIMAEWKAKQDAKKKDEINMKDVLKKKAQYSDDDDSEKDSNDSDTEKYKPSKDSESYEQDGFDDVSASGSGQQNKLTYWPGKKDYNKSEDSYSASQSQEKKNDDDEEVCDPGLMEAYLKKQKEQQAKSSGQQVKSPVQWKEPEESSERYDEDFESASKSNNALPQITPQTQTQKQPFDFKQQSQQQQDQYKSVLQSYVKKDNKFIQTEATKYDFMEPSDQINGTFKEWTLTQNLKDAENLIQELKSKDAEQKQKIYELEENYKKKDVEFQTQRRDAMNAQETSKRLQEQLKDSMHKINLYKIETEELIKQIDLADAKTREKEDEVKLVHAEYERKMKLQEERILFRRGKEDERGLYELKRQHMIEKEELLRKNDEIKEELDYYMQKVAKIEVENKSLRVGKDSNKRVKELEEQVEALKAQVSSSYSLQQENINLRNIKNELSKEDQVKLQRELQQLELMVKGYQEENEKAVLKQKQLQQELRTAQDKVLQESKKVKDLQQKALLEQDKVYVEKSQQELDIQTVNNMGLGNAISQKELQELHSQVKKLQLEKSDIERDLNLKDGQLKAKINKLRDEKADTEKKLFDTEYLVGEKEREITKLKDELMQEKQILNERIQELEDKVHWFRSNQKLLNEEEDEKQNILKELQSLREKVKKGEEDSRRARDLEKKCKMLEETIKSKNPNNIAMLIQAAKEKPESETTAEQQRLQERIKRLESEIEEKDRDFEKRIRTLRQEQERMKQMYEKRQGQTPEAKRVKELEDELQKTKDYYNKRIREVEDKYKFKINQPKEPLRASSAKPTQNKNQGGFSVEQVQVMKEQIDQLTKERNLLAQKVVNLQTETNKRRESFSGTQSQAIANEDHPKNQLMTAIGSLSNLIKASKDDEQKLFSLLSSCVTCVEQLKTYDAAKSNTLAQHFRNLTQEFHTSSTLNEKLLADIQGVCKPELSEQKPSPLRHMNSANMNKDISSVMFEEDVGKSHQKSPINSQVKPPKPVHPFVVQKSQQARPMKELLKAVVNSGIDFESVFEERGIKSKRIGISQMYQVLKEESALSSITLDEVKQLLRFVKEKSGNAVEEIGKGKSEEFDIQDFVNVMMDVSLDMFGNEPGPQKMTDSFLQSQPISNRYSQDKTVGGPKGNLQAENSSQVQELKDQIRKLKEDKEEEVYQYQNKVQRLQKNVSELTRQKDTLEERIEKLEASKQRMENILKQNLGVKNTMKKTLGSTGDSVDLLDEVGLMIKRLEYLEQQSEDREKQQQMEHVPCKREISRLMQALEEEKLDKARVLSKKNAEVAYFKAELDALLHDMKSTFGNKQRKQ